VILAQSSCLMIICFLFLPIGARALDLMRGRIIFLKLLMRSCCFHYKIEYIHNAHLAQHAYPNYCLICFNDARSHFFRTHMSFFRNRPNCEFDRTFFVRICPFFGIAPLLCKSSMSSEFSEST